MNSSVMSADWHELLVGFSQADQPQTRPTCGLHTHRKVSTFAMGGGAVRTLQDRWRPASSPLPGGSC